MKILRNGKWDGIWDRPKYQEIREKILNEFKDLVFDEGPHKYYLNGRELTCVSNVTHAFEEPFDVEKMAKITYEKNVNKKGSKYYRKTVSEIKEMWAENSKRACDFGTERHEFGESCFYFMTGQYDGILEAYKDRLIQDEKGYGFKAVFPEEEAAASFYEDLPQCIIPILAETKVYRVEKEYAYSGTFDLLGYYDAELDVDEKHPNGHNPNTSGLMVLDWKTNHNLFNNYGGKSLLHPFEELLDENASLYALQLSLYQLALEKLGFKIIGRRLMWLRDNGAYQKVVLKCYTKELDQALRTMNIK